MSLLLWITELKVNSTMQWMNGLFKYRVLQTPTIHEAIITVIDFPDGFFWRPFAVNPWILSAIHCIHLFLWPSLKWSLHSVNNMRAKFNLKTRTLIQ